MGTYQSDAKVGKKEVGFNDVEFREAKSWREKKRPAWRRALTGGRKDDLSMSHSLAVFDWALPPLTT